jgi:ATP-dependent helicase HrpA
VTVPVYVLNQVSPERCEWLVPGMLRDKVLALLRSLPQRPRSRLVPLPEFADAFCAQARFARGRAARRPAGGGARACPAAGGACRLQARDPAAHHFMNLRLVDEHGRQLAAGRSLATLQAQWGGQARPAFQALAGATGARPGGRARGGAPHRLDLRRTARAHGAAQGRRQVLVGFPALVDRGAHVEVEVFDEPRQAAEQHRAGLRRLFALQSCASR